MLDHYKGISHPLDQEAYHFSSTANTEAISDRFELVVLSKKQLSINEQTQHTFITAENDLLSINNSSSLLLQVSVYDLNGRLIHQTTDINQNSFEWKHQLSKGICVIESLTNNEVTRQKVILH